MRLSLFTVNNVTLATLYDDFDMHGEQEFPTEREAKAWAYGMLDGVTDDSRPVEVERCVVYEFKESE